MTKQMFRNTYKAMGRCTNVLLCWNSLLDIHTLG